MIRELMYKWFGLSPMPCETCEVLRAQLDESNRERKDLLHRLLDGNKTEPLVPPSTEELKSIQPAFIPWRVKQQMLEQEDRRSAELMKQKVKEIAELEHELGVQ